MKQSLLLIFMSVATLPGAPVVSNVRVDALSHSSLQLIWDNSTPINKIRVLFGSSTEYERSPGGGVFVPGTVIFSQYDQTLSLSGLAPDTDYHLCPQSSSDGGTTFSDCVDVPIHTPPLPQIHPAFPIPPRPVSLVFPPQSGEARHVAADCSDLQSHLSSARYGDTVLIPAGAVCSGSYVLPHAPDAKTFLPAQINTATSIVTLNQHGFTDQQKVRLATTGCLPGSAGPDPFCQLRGMLPGKDYFLIVLDQNNFKLAASPGGPALDFAVSDFEATVDTSELLLTRRDQPLADGTAIQLRSTGTLPGGLSPNTTYYVLNPNRSRIIRLAAAAGGPPLILTDAGTGTHSIIDSGHGTHYMLAWPPSDKWIVVRTSTPDDQFCPEGVRCTGAIWKAKMATIAKMGPPAGNTVDIRLQTGLLAHNWRFIGIEFTHDDNSAATYSTTDPVPYYGLIATNPTNANIVFDRCYIHGRGFPNRLYRVIASFDGENMALINSDLDQLDFWRPYRSPIGGVQPSRVDAHVISISPGTYYMGHLSPTVSTPVSIHVQSTPGSGTGLVYFDMSGALHALFPTGTQATCEGYSPCIVTTQDTPGWPLNEQGRYAGALVAYIALTADGVASVSTTGEVSVSATEGASSFIAGIGPGPFLIQNNRISGSGISMHFDDSGSSVYERNDYTVKRNLFTMPLSQQAGGTSTDHKRYSHRNHLEWKGGSRILVDGNIFENNVADITAGGPLVFTARAGGNSSDIRVSNNLFRRNAGGLGIAAVDSYSPVSRPVTRVHITNNLFSDIDGYQYSVPCARSSSPGIVLNIGYALEDVRIDHNTIYRNRGSSGEFLHFTMNHMEGVAITGNLLWVNNDTNRMGIGAESIPGCTDVGKKLLDCVLTAGVGKPDHQFRDNIILPGYSNSADVSSNVDPDQVARVYAGLPANFVVRGARLQDRLSALGFVAPPDDLRLRFDSPYKSGGASHAADGTDFGVNMDVLEQSLGKIGTPVALEISRTSALIKFLAPDPGTSCYVLYGVTESIAGWPRTSADTADRRDRQLALQNLDPGAHYSYAVLCAGASEQAEGRFATLQ